MRSLGLLHLSAKVVFCCATAALPAQSLAQALPAAIQSAPEAEYRINIGDELEVLVWGEDRMQRTVRIQPDGSFAFPLAGTIIAAGLTTQDVRAEIQRQLADKYRNGPPDVTVTVREATGMRFFVVGKVRTPGSYAASGAIDILQALSLAGGLADFADVKGAVILRKTPQGQFIERVQLAQVLKGSRRLGPGALAKPLPVLRSGDVLVIP
ncbi:polysaccharide biosynthesis/export family protein [Rhizorhapis suberifaciens]|uniref:Polysaccharide export outer membrane protein n=1 Tax=Rhizorhapis suberifaciens TaxID=13656 RepID=A0A840HTZ9_9SPHN|nr:polysaccharide biosynthesis/export family protein [Rhizorhapis suberifaciens]MBB4640976.1 polysaccharide export outer membrane protein [Rhizorhapis suberifaciens]